MRKKVKKKEKKQNTIKTKKRIKSHKHKTIMKTSKQHKLNKNWQNKM